MRKWIIEILKEAEAAENAVAVLEKHRHVVLDGILDLVKRDDVVWDLPEGRPPFKIDTRLPLGAADTNLYMQFRRLYLFWPGTNLNRMRKEMLFVQVLEGLHHEEAELLLVIKEGKFAEKFPRVWKALGMEPKKEAVVEQQSSPEIKPKPKGRGRPKGAKNKPKAVEDGTEE